MSPDWSAQGRNEASQGGGVTSGLSTRGSADSTSNPSVPSQYHSAVASPVSHSHSHSHRPSSAESSDSSSRYHTISSPHSQQYSFPSSSISSNIGGQAAFDYDDLLGPRPQPDGGSASSISPPSSEDDKLRNTGARLQGLGFTSSRTRSGTLGAGRAQEDWEDQDNVAGNDDHWLHLHSSARIGTALPTPPTSSPPSYPTSIPVVGKRREASNTTSGSGGVGSPLSPLVAPFSPGGGVGGIARPGGSPWAAAASTGFGSGTREKEVRLFVFASLLLNDTDLNLLQSSYGASASPFAPAPSYNSPSSQRFHQREPTFPTPSIPRLAGDMLSPAAYHAAHSSPYGASGFTPQLAQHDPNESPFPPPSTGLFAPPVSQPMSEASSRDALLDSANRGGYSRSGYAGSVPSTNGSALQLPPPPASGPVAGSVSGAESVNSSEEISTIFVVGFPEDMQEREFINMFLFAQGFEAATLKAPAAPTTTTAAVMQRDWERELGGTSSAGGSDAGHGPSSSFSGGGGGGAGEDSSIEQPACALPPRLLPSTASSTLPGSAKDPFAGLRESAASPLGFASSSSANGASTPLSSAGVGGGGGVRKQTIGFARFKTRAQALEAKEMLTGRKVDPEKGSVLKAEMAKKNLHTRKPTTTTTASGTETLGTPQLGGLAISSSSPALPPSSSSSSAVFPTSSSTAAATSPTSSTLPPGTGPSIPLSALDPNTRAKIANAGHMNPAVLAEIARQSMAAAMANRQAQAPPSTDLDSRSAFDAFHSVPAAAGRRDVFGGEKYGSRESLGQFGAGGVPLSPSMSESSISPPQHQANLFAAYASRGLPPPHLQQQQGVEEYGRPPPQPLFGSGGSGIGGVGGGGGSGSIAGLDPSLLPSSLSGAGRDRQPSFPSFGSAGGGGGAGGGGSATFGSPLPASRLSGNPLASPPLGSYSPSMGAIPRTQNPADMNAPKKCVFFFCLCSSLHQLEEIY